MTDSEQKKQHQELETVRHKFYQFQMRAGAEIEVLKKDKEALERQLTVTKAHSKAQSQRVQALQDSLQEKEHNLAISKKEIGDQQKLVKEQQRIRQRDIEALKKEKKELLSDLEAARAAAAIYKDDFERERSDRAKAAGKIDSLEKNAAENARRVAGNESSELKGKLEKAEEDLKDKTAQVKNFKKHADTLQDELKRSQEELKQVVDSLLETQEEAGKRHKKQIDILQAELQKARQTITENEMVLVPEPYSPTEPVDVSASIKLSKKDQLMLKFGRKPAAVKAEEKDRMKAKKLERERSVKETKEKRKATMEKMEEAKLKVFLERELNRLENENMTLKHQLECSEATTRSLVEKLKETERLVVKARGPSAMSHLHNPPPSTKRNRQGQEQPQIKRKGSSTSNVDSSSKHEQIHQQLMHRKKSSTEVYQKIESNLDTNDPALKSKTRDYVNFTQGPVPPPRTRPKALSPSDTPRSRKSPVPTPRSISHDPSRRGGGGGGLAAPDPQEQSISMPPMPVRREEEDDGILYGLEEDIHGSAHEVVETGRDGRTYTLTSIPFDPFLECLYCNRKFRYGEIQKYRKHVNNCTGSSAV